MDRDGSVISDPDASFRAPRALVLGVEAGSPALAGGNALSLLKWLYASCTGAAGSLGAWLHVCMETAPSPPTNCGYSRRQCHACVHACYALNLDGCILSTAPLLSLPLPHSQRTLKLLLSLLLMLQLLLLLLLLLLRLPLALLSLQAPEEGAGLLRQLRERLCVQRGERRHDRCEVLGLDAAKDEHVIALGGPAEHHVHDGGGECVADVDDGSAGERGTLRGRRPAWLGASVGEHVCRACGVQRAAAQVDHPRALTCARCAVIASASMMGKVDLRRVWP